MCAASAFAPGNAFIEGSVDNPIGSQQAFDAVAVSPPSSTSQQEMADAFSGYSLSLLSHGRSFSR